ncbi:hypothetical protein GCM10009855_17430 [Gordonia cholesterolivorans]|uniref:Uncharacterized protein n=2 Tax=Gordonia cholesterolivorans TaxID=559625 RepID=A0ABP5UHF9_9ACTN
MGDGPAGMTGSCADGFATVIAVCRELGLTAVDEAAVRRPHSAVDEFRMPAFVADAQRLSDLADRLARAAGAAGATATTVGEWSGRSGHAAGSAVRVVAGDVADLRSRLTQGAAVTTHAAQVLEEVLARHAAVLETVSRPRLGGVDLDAVPAALNAGAVTEGELRAEVHARLDYADSAGSLAADAIAAALAEVASAWTTDTGSAGELVLADLR